MAASYLLEYLIINYRWVFVCFFLIPASFIYNILFYARNWLIFTLKSAPKNHHLKVKDIQKQIRDWKSSGSTQKLCTARPGWLTTGLREGLYKKTMQNINIDLLDILEVDTVSQTVTVEPLVTMGQLSATLNQRGWMLAIVPELDDLTVGGMINGTGVESSSHKFGLMQHICLSYEIVLADGSLVHCSKDENSDLFYSIPWSHGTLGFLVAATLKIIPSKKYVRLNYVPCHSLEHMCQLFEEESSKENPADFVEGFAYSKDTGVIMTGNMTDEIVPEQVNDIGKFHKPWFYKHVEQFLSSGPATEYIPLTAYCHRHTRSLFWETQYIIPFGNHPLFRWTLGWLGPPKISLLKLTQGDAIRNMYEKHQFIQDMLIPVADLKDAIKIFHEHLKIYPLWLCPFKLPPNPGFLRPRGEQTTMYLDFGVYGEPTVAGYNAEKTTRKLEEYVRKIDGFQMLYADTYMTRDEFQKMFDHTLYKKMRKDLGCEAAFPEVYDKINKNIRK